MYRGFIIEHIFIAYDTNAEFVHEIWIIKTAEVSYEQLIMLFLIIITREYKEID